MKTTVDLPDSLLERSKTVARQQNLTLKALIEEGLHLALLARSQRSAAPFSIRAFAGDGLSSEFSTARWEAIRDEIYRDRD